jgi:hypothetical protein
VDDEDDELNHQWMESDFDPLADTLNRVRPELHQLFLNASIFIKSLKMSMASLAKAKSVAMLPACTPIAAVHPAARPFFLLLLQQTCTCECISCTACCPDDGRRLSDAKGTSGRRLG